tara:strand:- start:1441 stop:1575 length:135 start_codon:yes stop_codon:yes gene_type:complete
MTLFEEYIDKLAAGTLLASEANDSRLEPIQRAALLENLAILATK